MTDEPVGTFRTMRRTLLSAVALGLVACVGPPAATATDVDTRGVELARVDRAMQAVAERQATAEQLAADALGAVRDLDHAIESLRDPDRIDDLRERWPTVRPALDELDGPALTAAADDLRAAVDEARTAVARARDTLDDEWEAAYVAVQDDVLTAVRAHALATSELAAALERHRPVYEALVAEAATSVADRWLHRTETEAADAFEVAVAPHRTALDTARRELGAATQARRATATGVNAAADRAAAVWADRPAGRPTAVPSP